MPRSPAHNPFNRMVVCEGCANFRPDPINQPAGMGTCVKGLGMWHPMAGHRCKQHTPNEPTE